MTDYHSHILPGMDDGAADADESVKMLELLNAQGVKRVVATPHFFAHIEKSAASFLQKRDGSKNKIPQDSTLPKIVTGAEVSLEHGISEVEGIETLAIEGTKLILLEPSYYGFSDKSAEDVYCISCDHKLKPVIAHVHRYIGFYRKAEIEKLLGLDAIFQINIDAFSRFSERSLVVYLIKEGFPVVFGSDCHNIGRRPPNFDLLIKYLKKHLKDNHIIEDADNVMERYSI